MNFRGFLLFKTTAGACCFHSWMQFPTTVFAVTTSLPSSDCPGRCEVQVWKEKEKIQRFHWCQLINRREWQILMKGSGNNRCKAWRIDQCKVFYRTICLQTWEKRQKLTKEVNREWKGKVSTKAKNQIQLEYILRDICMAFKLHCSKAWVDTRK